MPAVRLQQLGLAGEQLGEQGEARVGAGSGQQVVAVGGAERVRPRSSGARRRRPSSASSTVAGGTGIAELGGQGEHPAEPGHDRSSALRRRSRPAPSGQSSTSARGIRVVGEPLARPGSGGCRPRRSPTGRRRSGVGLDDAGHGADAGADVAAADLAPPLDEHDAELRLAGEAVRRPAPGSAARTRAAGSGMPGSSTLPSGNIGITGTRVTVGASRPTGRGRSARLRLDRERAERVERRARRRRTSAAPRSVSTHDMPSGWRPFWIIRKVMALPVGVSAKPARALTSLSVPVLAWTRPVASELEHPLAQRAGLAGDGHGPADDGVAARARRARRATSGHGTWLAGSRPGAVVEREPGRCRSRATVSVSPMTCDAGRGRALALGHEAHLPGEQLGGGVVGVGEHLADDARPTGSDSMRAISWSAGGRRARRAGAADRHAPLREEGLEGLGGERRRVAGLAVGGLLVGRSR